MQDFRLEDGFVQIPKNVLHERNITTGQFYTYAHLRSHRNNNDFLGCFPGLDTLARETGFTRETVSGHLKALSLIGLIGIKHRFNNSNIYSFPTEYKNCSCTSLCKKSAKKKDIYWDYCIEHLQELRMKESELRESYINIYEIDPTIDDLRKFIIDIEIAKEIKDENR